MGSWKTPAGWIQRSAFFLGLSVGTTFNAMSMPHRGPHPAGYHQWVLDNVNLINADIDLRLESGELVLEDAPLEFQLMFEANVTNWILQDPTIVRFAYWRCHPPA